MSISIRGRARPACKVDTLRVQRVQIGGCRISILGIVIMVLGTYLLFGSLDP